ncbi:MAG: hypothetical protein AAFR87_10825 [Bacteroidota bacterium]
MQNDSTTAQENWIEERRNQSWQIEIVIVGGAILFLTQIPDLLMDLLATGVEGQGRTLSAEYILVVFGGLVFSRALLISFILNLLLRAIWLGYLAIKFSFPKGIDFNKLNYSEHFQSKIDKESDTLDKVIFLERLCSLTYAVGIMMTIMAIGLFSFLIILSSFLHYFIPSLYSQSFFFIFLLISFLFVLGAFDYIFFKVLGKASRLNKIYYPIHRFFSLLTLNFLYRREWLTLSSRVSRWGISLMFIFYFFLAFFIAQEELNRKFGMGRFINFGDLTESRNYSNFQKTYQRIHSHNYVDMMETDDRVAQAAIQSSIVKDHHLQLFIVYRKSYDLLLDSLFNQSGFISELDKIRWDEVQKNDRKFNNALREMFSVYVDADKKQELNWYFHKLPLTQQEGFISYIPLDSLSSGEHRIAINHRVFRGDSLGWWTFSYFPFVKE